MLVLLSSGVARSDGGILLVSRQRLLTEPAVARRLADAEREMTATLQGQMDSLKAAFSEEEQELTRLRGTLAREVFDERVAKFDREVRAARRDAQSRAAALQTAFREARSDYEAAVLPVLERVRAERGASMIVNAESALVADPAADVTDEVIVLLDEALEMPALPVIDGLTPGTEKAPGASRVPRRDD